MYDTTTWVTTAWANKKIHEIIDMTTNAPEKLIVVHNWTKVPVTKKTDYEEEWEKITTYIKEDKTRIFVYQGDKIETIETPEQKYKKNKDSFTTEFKKIIKDKPNEYKGFDFSKFIYNTNPLEIQKKYQDKILVPLQNIFTNTDQYKLFIQELDLSKAEWIHQDTSHIKNMLQLIDGTNVTTKYTDAIANLWIEWNTYTITKDWENLIITSKKWDTINGTITLSNTDNKLTAKREATTSAT